MLEEAAEEGRENTAKVFPIRLHPVPQLQWLLVQGAQVHPEHQEIPEQQQLSMV
jgi:hypothetical protein